MQNLGPEATAHGAKKAEHFYQGSIRLRGSSLTLKEFEIT